MKGFGILGRKIRITTILMLSTVLVASSVAGPNTASAKPFLPVVAGAAILIGSAVGLSGCGDIVINNN